MTDPTAAAMSGRHPLNIGHLVMGLAFAGLVAVWAILQADVVELSDARWLLPLPWVVAGAIGLAATALPNRRRKSPAAAGWVADDTAETTRDDEPAYPDLGGTDTSRTEDTTVLDDLTASPEHTDRTDPTEEIR